MPAQDTFSPTLYSSEVLEVSPEQTEYLRRVLQVACSDSRFVEKAIAAFNHILTGGSVIPPTVTSLVPAAVVLGSPSFDVHVKGTGFTADSIIVFNGFDEPTTFVSATDVSTGVNMPLWLAPATVPIGVRNLDGSVSNMMTFSFTEAGTQSRKLTEERKEDAPRKEDVPPVRRVLRSEEKK